MNLKTPITSSEVAWYSTPYSLLPDRPFPLSPLQIVANQPYDKAVDWWSYGVLLYEMLAGQVTLFSRAHASLQRWSFVTTSKERVAALPSNVLTSSNAVLSLFSSPLVPSSPRSTELTRRSSFSPSWSRASSTPNV